MGLPQYRQRPRKSKKLKIGIKSYQRKVWPHLGQWERLLIIPSPVSSRQMTTFKKLPAAEPKRKMNR